MTSSLSLNLALINLVSVRLPTCLEKSPSAVTRKLQLGGMHRVWRRSSLGLVISFTAGGSPEGVFSASDLLSTDKNPRRLIW
jgi:hypothetical protein